MLKTVVVMQYLGIGDTLHPRYHSIDKGQGQLCRMIQAASAPPSNMSLEDTLQVQFSAKPLKNEHAAEECEGRILEGKPDVFDEFSHLPEMHPAGARLSGRFYSPHYTIFSSVIAALLLQKRRNSPFFQVEY
jgi:hypothetical protein